MGSLQLTIAVLALAATAAGQCWSNTLCDFDEQNDIKVKLDAVAFSTFEEQMTECQSLCAANTEITCTHFSVFIARGVNCYLLEECVDSSTPECLALGTCNSGPADCAVNQNCPQLTAPAAGTDYIPWQCDGDVNPYTQQIPEDTACFLSCKSWITTDGVPASITSSCVAGGSEGEWNTPVIEGALAADVPPLAGVDLTTVTPDGANLACSCAIQPMSWNIGTDIAENLIAYDPNELPGTDFICSGDSGVPDVGDCATNPKCYLTGAEGSKVFELDPAYTCRLFCDSYHIATMTCDGVWTGEPELGAWCYAEPTADDDVNTPPGN